MLSCFHLKICFLEYYHRIFCTTIVNIILHINVCRSTNIHYNLLLNSGCTIFMDIWTWSRIFYLLSIPLSSTGIAWVFFLSSTDLLIKQLLIRENACNWVLWKIKSLLEGPPLNATLFCYATDHWRHSPLFSLRWNRSETRSDLWSDPRLRSRFSFVSAQCSVSARFINLFLRFSHSVKHNASGIDFFLGLFGLPSLLFS